MRLSEVFKAFLSIVAAVGADFAAKVADAIEAAIGDVVPKTARVLKGVTYHDRPVDLGLLGEGLQTVLRPEALHGDGRGLVQAVTQEVARRGTIWESQCLAAALEDHLVKPLRAVKDKPKAEKAEGGKKAKAA